ncbi:MAG TPA: PQQ-binding-like beta-propeller repeat protein [Vicinamibacterales bacterium]|nr:PQQ-binding-like beta-propeller repeat protein [Vicinamibacterales bacterium]
MGHPRRARWITVVIVCAIAAAVWPGRTTLRAQRGAPTTGEWRTYGGDLGNTKYSPLDQINASNFGTLKVAWRWTSADAFLSKTVPGGGELWTSSRFIFEQLQRENPKRWRDNEPPYVSNFKATPLMVGGRIYLNMPTSAGAAIDARTGRTIWVYNPKSYEAGTTTMSARWNQRGVAYWTDGKEQRIFWGTGDGYLLALDAITGHPVESFGDRGRVDLMTGLPRATRGSRDWLNALTYSVQSPPLVVRDTIITPASISSYNRDKEQIPGYTRGFDARTGKLKWTFNTIPRPGEVGNETWERDSWSYTGKVSGWTIYSADEELGYAYIPLNTAAPDYYGGHRLGDNLFSDTLLCLNVETGKRVWHYQLIHHDLWDYDPPAAPNLLDITVDGRRIKAVAQVTKQGLVFTFDRVTGQPIWPIEERPVPASDVPGERASPTQPFPTRPPPFEYLDITKDLLVDFTPEIRALAEKAVENYRLGPLYTPPSLMVKGGNQGTLGLGQRAGWSGAAVDPDTGMLYVPSRQSPTVFRLKEPEGHEKGTLRFVQAREGFPRLPGGMPIYKPPYSRMTAIDMNKGEHAWMQPTGHGYFIRNHPLLKDLNLPPLGGDSSLSGPLLTKTLLISALTSGGSRNQNGPRLVARDKKTGNEVASVDLPAGALGAPMTYMLDGRQYIAVTVGGSPYPELIVLTLP